jgi:hypothetical protein
MKLAPTALLLAAWATPGLGCDLCALYSATAARNGEGGSLYGGVAEQYTYFHTLQSEGQEVDNVGNEYLHSSISQVFAGYNFTRRLGVQFNLPVIYRAYGYFDQRGSESGLGDVSLLVNGCLARRLTEDFSFNWTALGGVKFPTGNTSQLNPEQEDFAPGIGGHDLTLGSGSFDGLFGTGFTVRWRRVFLAGMMQYALRTEGAYGYQFANDWTWLGGPGVYLLLTDRHSLALQVAVSGETKGQDTLNGVPTDDTAVTSVLLGPQLTYTWSSRLSALVAVDFPVSIVSSGTQIVPTYRLRGAFTWQF